MLAELHSLNKRVKDCLINFDFKILNCNVDVDSQRNEIKLEVTTKIEDAEIRIHCNDKGTIMGFVDNYMLPSFKEEERKEITKYLFCECAPIITEKNKQQIDSLQEAIKKLS